ncbi:MAG: TIGR02147 family protein [Bdellovibrionota bacterium]
MKDDYRNILSAVLEERSAANSAYSLRSYARDLDIAPSTLSEILNGKKGLSKTLANSIAKKLRLPDWEANYFCDLVAKQHAKSPKARAEAKERLKTRKTENHVHVINQRATKALTSWVDLAILELTHLKNFKPSILWIAKKLNIDETRVSNSVKRLEEAQLLEIDRETGVWSDISPLFSSTDGVPNESIRNFHKTVLKLALEKLENPDVNARTVKTVIFSVSEANAANAKTILNDAITQIVSLADDGKQERENVLCFSGQLFSLLNKGISNEV